MSASLMSPLTPSPLTRSLPVELVDVILEYIASLSQAMCLALCLVSSRAQAIALPHLYGAIDADELRRPAQFLQTVRAYPKLAKRIRRIQCFRNIRQTYAIYGPIMSSCPRVEAISVSEHLFRILIGGRTWYTENFSSPVLRELRIQCKTAQLPNWRSFLVNMGSKERAILRQFTHVHFSGCQFEPDIIPIFLTIFPCATHLALRLEPSESSTIEIPTTHEPPALKVLAIVHTRDLDAQVVNVQFSNTVPCETLSISRNDEWQVQESIWEYFGSKVSLPSRPASKHMNT
jgi:hypothetical protein